jgi:hypothetical protein
MDRTTERDLWLAAVLCMGALALMLMLGCHQPDAITIDPDLFVQEEPTPDKDAGTQPPPQPITQTSPSPKVDPGCAGGVCPTSPQKSISGGVSYRRGIFGRRR